VLVFTLVFAVGIVWVSIVMRVIVPLILRLLSLFLPSRALLSAADAVRDAGRRAVDGMARSRRWMQGGGLVPDDREDGADAEGPSDDRVRVDVGAAVRQVRIEDVPDDPATREEEEPAREHEPRGKRPA
jgi:hypothetical protein